MKKIRDMTKVQFLTALKRHGMRVEGIWGYVDLGLPDQRISVSVYNAGTTNRRAQLAFLLRERERYEKVSE